MNPLFQVFRADKPEDLEQSYGLCAYTLHDETMRLSITRLKPNFSQYTFPDLASAERVISEILVQSKKPVYSMPYPRVSPEILAVMIGRESNRIAVTNRRGPGNHVIIPTGILDMFEAMNTTEYGSGKLGPIFIADRREKTDSIFRREGTFLRGHATVWSCDEWDVNHRVVITFTDANYHSDPAMGFAFVCPDRTALALREPDWPLSSWRDYTSIVDLEIRADD